MASVFKRRDKPVLPVTGQDGDDDSAKASGSGAGRESSDGNSDDVTWKERMKHFTWAWFTFPMSTGGIALLLASTPNRFDGLTTIGKVVYIFDLCIFLALCIGITIRFFLDPPSFMRSLRHPTEALFIPTFWLALVIIINGMQDYGVPNVGPWLPVALRILFWWYLACTFILAVAMYLYLFTAPPQRLTVQSMTPAWILPIFPIMLTGTLAGVILPSQPDVNRVSIITAGVLCQGLGWMVAFLMYSAYIQRLIQYGLPAPNLRPGMFIATGPPSFTGVALISMSKGIPQGYEYFGKHPEAADIIINMALWTAIFLWLLGFWFFCISLLAVLMDAREMSFHLVWWALVFPNVGFTLALIQIGHGLSSPGILWVGSAMTILLVAVWLFVMFMHARALWKKQILMPGKDEDKDAYREDDRKHGIPVPPRY